MHFSDEQLLPISALQHLVFCERQCGLIHVEQMWVENRFTVEGRQMHETAHAGPDENRANVTIARGMPLRSVSLGLYGIADVVELFLGSEEDFPFGSHSQIDKFTYDSMPWKRYSRVVPIEYKRGKPKRNDCDRVQLCAQAMCLEEMMQCEVSIGFLFYGKRKRRTQVNLDERLRQRTHEATIRLHAMIANRETPRARRESKCDTCSLVEICLPSGTGPDISTKSMFQRQLAAALKTNDGPQLDSDLDAFE